MLVIRALDRADSLKVGESRTQVSDPVDKSVRRPSFQLENHPRKIRTVRFEPPWVAGRARQSDQAAVQNEGLNPAHQETLEPARDGKLGFVLRKIAEGASARPKPERVIPTLACLVIEIVVAAGNFVDHCLEILALGRQKRSGRIGREGKPWATDAPLVDWGWHGTLISSIAARFAPGAELTMYKFGDGDTQNDPAYQLLMECIVAASVYKAVHDGNDIISISASGASLDLDYLREACQYAFDNNCVIVSGGLYSRWYKQGNVLNFPSQYETVFTVTAAGKKEDGSYGYWDVCAPGETNDVVAPNDIFGAFPTYVEEEDTYIPSISAAIPVVSSLFALLISEYPRTGEEAPGKYAQTLMDLVRNNANPRIVGFEGFSPECGYGMIDAEKTLKAAVQLSKNR